MMTSAPDKDKDDMQGSDKKSASKDKSPKSKTGAVEKKTKKSVKSKTKDKEKSVTDETAKPKMKRTRASAKAIDETQSKRKVKVKRTVKKVSKIRKGAAKDAEPKVKPRNIGVEVVLPKEVCSDPHCPFHGRLSVRGQVITGVVVSSKMDKTAIVQREISRYVPKYERYEKRSHKYAVHNPKCLNVQRGDIVKIMECRPLSKSKTFVVIEKI
jgi:small subunit ribosomal protein S17